MLTLGQAAHGDSGTRKDQAPTDGKFLPLSGSCEIGFYQVTDDQLLNSTMQLTHWTFSRQKYYYQIESSPAPVLTSYVAMGRVLEISLP